MASWRWGVSHWISRAVVLGVVGGEELVFTGPDDDGDGDELLSMVANWMSESREKMMRVFVRELSFIRKVVKLRGSK